MEGQKIVQWWTFPSVTIECSCLCQLSKDWVSMSLKRGTNSNESTFNVSCPRIEPVWASLPRTNKGDFTFNLDFTGDSQWVSTSTIQVMKVFPSSNKNAVYSFGQLQPKRHIHWGRQYSMSAHSLCVKISKSPPQQARDIFHCIILSTDFLPLHISVPLC